MVPIIYSNKFLHRHSLWSVCGCNLNADISERDYPGKNYFDTRIDALDMDRYEAEICHGQADSTADSVIGVMTCNNKKTSNPRLLLVELRMNYRSADTLSKQSMERKVVHTKQLLGSDFPINPTSLFVFTDHVAPQARHWVEARKHEGGEIRNFEVLSVSEFAENVKSYEDMPYKPIYKSDDISEGLRKLIEDEKWTEMLDQIKFLYDKAVALHYQNPFEYDNLRTIILSEWSKIREQYPHMAEDDDELEAQIIEEDIMTIFQ